MIRVLELQRIDEVGDQGIAFFAAQRIKNRLRDREPLIGGVLRFDRVLEIRRDRVRRSRRWRSDGGGGSDGLHGQTQDLHELESFPQAADAGVVRVMRSRTECRSDVLNNLRGAASQICQHHPRRQLRDRVKDKVAQRAFGEIGPLHQQAGIAAPEGLEIEGEVIRSCGAQADGLVSFLIVRGGDVLQDNGIGERCNSARGIKPQRDLRAGLAKLGEEIVIAVGGHDHVAVKAATERAGLVVGWVGGVSGGGYACGLRCAGFVRGLVVGSLNSRRSGSGLKYIDQAIGRSRRAFAQIGVVGERKELREQRRGFRGVIVAHLGGQHRNVEIVELRGVGGEVAEFALVDGSDGENLQNFGEQHLRARESVDGLLGIERDLIQRTLGQSFALQQHARAGRAHVEEIEGEMIRHASLELHELAHLGDVVRGGRLNDGIGEQRIWIG